MTPILLMPMNDILLAWEALDGRNAHEVGRTLLQRLYREKTGSPLPQICIAERGKPYFPDGSAHFSISHTKHFAFCALADRPIGLDAEEADRKINLKLAEKILSPREKARFDAASDPRDVLLRLWVLKEAAAKYSGEGLRGYPNHTDFSPEDSRIRSICGCYVAIVT